MKNLNFLKDVDYFDDYQIMIRILDIIENNLIDDRLEYDLEDFKSSYSIDDNHAERLYEILRSEEDLLLYKIINRVLNLDLKFFKDKKEINLSRLYIISLFECYDFNAYKNISDYDLLKDVADLICLYEE